MKEIPKQMRAELFISLQEQIRPDLDYNVAFESIFKRNYEQDIINLKEVLKATDTEGINPINIKVSRDGLYKSLPEGLFHDCNRFSKNRKLDSDGHADEMKKQQQEVANAKKFFAPFDSYLFKQQLQYERKINGILNRNIYSIVNTIILNYNLEDEENPYIQRCLGFIPFVNRLKGNTARLANVLGYVLRTPVRILRATEQRMVKIPRGLTNSSLGHARLSENFVVGHEYTDTYFIWKIIVVAENKVFNELMKNKELIDRFFSFFSDYFLSKDIEVNLKLSAREPVKFSLGRANTKQSFLGCNIRL